MKKKFNSSMPSYISFCLLTKIKNKVNDNRYGL